MIKLDNIVETYKEEASDEELENIISMCNDILKDRERERAL